MLGTHELAVSGKVTQALWKGLAQCIKEVGLGPGHSGEPATTLSILMNLGVC